MNEIPGGAEVTNDASTLLHSTATIARALVTSSTFRLLLTDLIGMVRDVVGDTAAQVEHVAGIVGETAQTVEDVARNIQTVARPDIDAGTRPFGNVSERPANSSPISVSPSQSGSRRMRDTVVNRLQEVTLSILLIYWLAN